MDPEFLKEYLPVIIFFCVATALALLVTILPRLLAKARPTENKLKPYECGFDPFGEARSKFDVRFYLVAVLFIIFDLEVAFLIPWAISLGKIGAYGFFSMIFFLGVLTLGFVYEWKKGALDWE